MTRSSRSDALLILACAAALVWCYWPFATLQFAISPWHDTIYLTGPLFCEISHSAAVGKPALFNWSTFESLDYNTHIAPYYPFYLFDFLDFCSAEKASQASDLIALLHLAILFATSVVLARTAGAGITGAMVGAMAATTSLNAFALAVFPTIIAPVAWLPLAVAGLVLILFRGQTTTGIAALVVGTAAMLTAGPGTNMLAALVFMALALGGYAIYPLLLTRNLPALRSIGLVAIGAGVLIAIASLASTLNLYAHIEEIVRWTRTGAVIGGSGPKHSLEILTEQLKWRDLPQLVMPWSKSYAVGSYFFGPATLLLALVGAYAARRHRIARAFALTGLIALSLVFLLPSFIVALWAFVPGLSHVRHLSVLATPLMLVVGVFAAFGADALLTPDRLSQSDRRVVVILTVAVAALCLLGLRPPAYSGWSKIELIALAMAACGCVILIATLANRSHRCHALVALVAIHTLLVSGSIGKSPGVPAVTQTPTWTSLQSAVDWIARTDPSPGRLVFDPSIDKDGLNWMTGGTTAAYRGLPTFHFYMSPRIYWKFAVENNADLSFYARLGGKYLLSMRDVAADVAEERFRSGDIRVYRLRQARPLVATVCAAGRGIAPPTANKLAAHPGRLPQLDAAIAAALDPARSGQLDCPGQRPDATRIEPRADRLTWQTPPGADRIVIINVPPYASWRLEIAGKSIPAYNLQDTQTVAFLPSGVEGVSTLTYRPSGYLWRLWISKIFWLFLLIGVVVLLFRQDARSALFPRAFGSSPQLGGSGTG